MAFDEFADGPVCGGGVGGDVSEEGLIGEVSAEFFDEAAVFEDFGCCAGEHGGVVGGGLDECCAGGLHFLAA